MLSIFLEPLSTKHTKYIAETKQCFPHLELTMLDEALASTEVCALPELPDAGDRARNRRSGSAAVLELAGVAD